MHSVIVFSDRCVLKNIKLRSNETIITNYRNIPRIFSHICSQKDGDLLTQAQITDLYNRLYPSTQVGYETRNQHANSAKYFRL